MKYLIEHNKTKEQKTVSQKAWNLIQSNRNNAWTKVSEVKDEAPAETKKPTPKTVAPAPPGNE